ncbi:MAG TPA: RodZ domain-containing protein [Solirubrobacteraceae bacterium]|nr:RodZ domain-containing protein [Solirubrobacteraceae bacterium]
MDEIGSTLREARMRARIDISEVEARTKIRAKYLRAIENEEWDLLPGPVYVKSFLRTYGDFLGLDSRLLIDEFKRRYERPDDHEIRPLASVARDRERNRRRVSGPSLSPRVVIGIALVAIFAALYVIGNSGNKNNAGDTGIAPPNTHHHTSTSSTPPTNTDTDTQTNTVQTRTTPPPPKKATLAIVPTGVVWICVASSSGQVLVEKTFASGETVPAQSAGELLATFGNGLATVTINGKAYRLPTSGVTNLKVTPTGAHTLNAVPTACR